MRIARVRRGAIIRGVLERARTFGKIRSMSAIHALDGSPYTMSGIRSAWKRAVARARTSYLKACETRGENPIDTMFVGITIKDLRPKAFTDEEAAGYDIQELKTAAAHSSVTTIEGYLKPRSGAGLREALRSPTALPLPSRFPQPGAVVIPRCCDSPRRGRPVGPADHRAARSPRLTVTDQVTARAGVSPVESRC